jgi:hypothetical protein
MEVYPADRIVRRPDRLIERVSDLLAMEKVRFEYPAPEILGCYSDFFLACFCIPEPIATPIATPTPIPMMILPSATPFPAPIAKPTAMPASI